VEWWPGAESNRRHADFQYKGGVPGAPGSRRPGRGFRRPDRTALPDRADSEPLRPNSGPNRRRGPCVSRGCRGADRTGAELGHAKREARASGATTRQSPRRRLEPLQLGPSPDRSGSVPDAASRRPCVLGRGRGDLATTRQGKLRPRGVNLAVPESGHQIGAHFLSSDRSQQAAVVPREHRRVGVTVDGNRVRVSVVPRVTRRGATEAAGRLQARVLLKAG